MMRFISLLLLGLCACVVFSHVVVLVPYVDVVFAVTDVCTVV